MKPIRNETFNYKHFVKELDVPSSTQDNAIYPCECNEYIYKNDFHNHIVTGDLRIVKCNKTRKILSKGPKFRESLTINWKRIYNSVEAGLQSCAVFLFGLDISCFKD